MKATISGINADGTVSPAGITVNVAVDAAGEKMPPITINGTGGKLDVYRSKIAATGTVSFHLFGADGEPLVEKLAAGCEAEPIDDDDDD